MNSAFRNILAGLAAVAVCGSLPALAQVKNQGYVTDSNGNVVTATGAGVCVRNAQWTPALAAAAEACKQCTPDLCPARSNKTRQTGSPPGAAREKP